jgi:hypothetical protein
VWLVVEPRTPDLAGQVYRVGLFRDLGFALWDEHWYAGHHLPAYSLLYPPLGWLLGERLLACACVVVSTYLFARLVTPVYGARARWGTAAFAVAAVADVWIGRLAFALGVTFALAAALAYARSRDLTAVALSVVCAAASPVAALLLGLAALTRALRERVARPLLVLGLPAAVVVVCLALLFPEGGWEPYPLRSFLATLLVIAAFLWGLPRGPSMLRFGALVYLAVCVAVLLVHTPIGSNVERYAALLAAPLLLCATPAGSRRLGLRPWPRVRRLLAVGVIGVWVVWGPVRETAAVAGSPATEASYYVPVERFLAALPGGPVRVEVPLTRSHWEAALLAPHVALARGWEKQLEERYDAPLLSSGLTPARYLSWLRAQAVAYVALPDAALDPSSAREGRLIEAGLPYLHEVFASRHWRIFGVLGATPLVSGPARLTSLGHDTFSLRTMAAGRVLVRVHYTRYWTITAGGGCVSRAPAGWTYVDTTAAGTVTVAARFSLARAFGSGGRCG